MLALSSLLVALLITSQWFSPGRLLAGGDNFPPYVIDPAKWMQRMRYAWDLGGAGGPNSLIEVLPQIVSDYLLRTVFAPGEAQHAFYALLYGAQFLSMVFFVLSILPKHRIAAFMAALFYCFNPFVVLVPPGYLGLFLLVYLPFMAALFIRTVTKPLHIASLAIFAVSASLSGMLFVNPPLYMTFLLFAVAIILYAIVPHWRSKVPLRVGLLMAIFVVANVYWIAQVYFVLFGSGHQQIVAAPAQDWSFVARRSSILNMFWLNPTWAWDYYFPYASVYKTPLLLTTIFLPAALAFSALLNRSAPRRVVLPALGAALALLLVSTGLYGQDPSYTVNQFLFLHVPLFWLFREPDTKFPFLILVLYAPLIGYQVEWLARQLARVLRHYWVGAIAAKACLLTTIGLAFIITAFPLVTGQVVGRSPTTPGPPGVALPSYWFNLKDYLSRQDPRGEVLLLPNDDFYQMPYSWGYYGADALPGEFIPGRSTTINAVSGYTSATASGVNLNALILQAMKDSTHPSILPYLAAQGIKDIVQRNDIVTGEPGRHILSPKQVQSYLKTQHYLHFVRSFGKLELYEVDRRSYVPLMYAVALPKPVASRVEQAGVLNAYLLSALGAHVAMRGIAPRSASKPTSGVMSVPWTQISPVRMVIHINATTRPLLLVFSTIYNPNWHACVVPAGASIHPWTCWFNGFLPRHDHVVPLKVFNGWLVSASPGRYTVVIDLGVQHITDAAALLSLLGVGGLVVATVMMRCWGIIQEAVRTHRRAFAFHK